MGGTPSIFFKIGTDVHLDQPSNLAEETPLCIDI